MEDTHWETVVNNGSREYSAVLILVLMEDTHWGVGMLETLTAHVVLILVLMEDTHWADMGKTDAESLKS